MNMYFVPRSNLTTLRQCCSTSPWRQVFDRRRMAVIVIFVAVYGCPIIGDVCDLFPGYLPLPTECSSNFTLLQALKQDAF